MEKVLDRKTGHECKLVKNRLDLYDLRVMNAEGAVTVKVKNVSLHMAMTIIKEEMSVGNLARNI